MKKIRLSTIITPVEESYHLIESSVNAICHSAISLFEVVSLVSVARNWNRLYDNSDTYDFTEVKDWDFPPRESSHAIASQEFMAIGQTRNSMFRMPALDFMWSIVCSIYRVVMVLIYSIIFVNAYAVLAILPDQKLRTTIGERLRIYRDHVSKILLLIEQSYWESLHRLFRSDDNAGTDEFQNSSMICSLCDEPVNISRMASVAIGKNDNESISYTQANLLSCQHVFCTACITRWAHTEWSNHRRATCPFCRRKFSMIVSCSQISCPNSHLDDGFSLTPLVCQEQSMQFCELFLATAFTTVTFLSSPSGANSADTPLWYTKAIFLISLIPWMAKWVPFQLVDFAVLAALIAYDQVSFHTWTVSLFSILAFRDEVRVVRILSGLLIYQTIIWLCLSPQILQSIFISVVSFGSRFAVPGLIILSTTLFWSSIQVDRFCGPILKQLRNQPLLRVLTEEGIFSVIASSFNWVSEGIRAECDTEKRLKRKHVVVLLGGAILMQTILWLGFLLAASYCVFHFSCFVLAIGAQLSHFSVLPDKIQA